MPSLDESFPAIVNALTKRYGRAGPPASWLEPFDAIVATVLARSLDAKKRETAVAALRDEGLLEPQTLAEADPAEVADALSSAGLSVSKSALVPLRRLARWLVELHHGSADELVGLDSPAPIESLREELLSVNGIGPATADAVLLFALRRHVYPLDRPTYRILARHGWIDPDLGYDEARDVVERVAPDDPALLVNLGDWFQQIGREFCRAGKPKCEHCPLIDYLPDGGPIEPNG
jgi:endonuclease-3 related protein